MPRSRLRGAPRAVRVARPWESCAAPFPRFCMWDNLLLGPVILSDRMGSNSFVLGCEPTALGCEARARNEKQGSMVSRDAWPSPAAATSKSQLLLSFTRRTYLSRGGPVHSEAGPAPSFPNLGGSQIAAAAFQNGGGGLMLETTQGHPAGPIPVPAYCGSSKNLKDIQAGGNFSALWFRSLHPPGGNPGANLKSISHKCYLFEVAFVWELTKETIGLALGCLQGGFLSSPPVH